MLVRDVMGPPVPTIPADMSVAAAARRMRHDHLSCLLVADGERLTGMLTEHDLLWRATAEGLSPDHASVRDIQSAPLLSCSDTETTENAAELMATHGLTHLPVMDGRGHLVGMVTPGDVEPCSPDSSPFETIGVTFFKNIPDSYGHTHPVKLATVYVTVEDDRAHALDSAQRRLAEKHGADHWTQVADSFEVMEASSSAN
ncbi:MAG: hypothetical protein CMM50_17660 [Rhodospirillaceae bacterium]|nr:hypothetical protein [Rhodospirillaceae bacterium]|tara:strand:- start:85 stop:684 length:600 start_codon:yes stop_codon:yes gene_type:complete